MHVFIFNALFVLRPFRAFDAYDDLPRARRNCLPVRSLRWVIARQRRRAHPGLTYRALTGLAIVCVLKLDLLHGVLLGLGFCVALVCVFKLGLLHGALIGWVFVFSLCWSITCNYCFAFFKGPVYSGR